MALLSEVVRRLSASWMILAIEVLLFLVLVSFARHLRSWYRLRAFKGPFLAKFSDLWLIRHQLGGSMHLDLFEVTEKYGRLRIGMRLDPSRDNVLSQRDDQKHGALRAKMAAGVRISYTNDRLRTKCPR
jgi:hypothetical protein